MIEEQIDERGGKLSASGLERATLCNGSPAAEKGKPENLMAETTAGTRIHDAVEVDDPTKLEDEDEQKMAVRLMELRDLEIAEWSKGEEVNDEREIRLIGFEGEFSGKPDGVSRSRAMKPAPSYMTTKPDTMRQLRQPETTNSARLRSWLGKTSQHLRKSPLPFFNPAYSPKSPKPCMGWRI